MNRVFAVLSVVVSLFLAIGVSRATTAASKPTEAAQAEADQWLQLVDEGKYGESWEDMAPSFREEVRKSRWERTIDSIRKPLGKLATRKLESDQFTKELAGAPEGEYVVLKYDADFKKKPGTVETVTLVLSQDLVWNVTGYSVK